VPCWGFPIGAELLAGDGRPATGVPGSSAAAGELGAAAFANPVLAEVVRSGVVESRHRGSLVVLAADGSVLLAAGSADRPMFPRSANKPMQAAAMLRYGLRLDGELLALAAASHSGEDFHVAGVREILSRAGLSESDLQCPPDLPLDDGARNAWLRSGGVADRLHMNCSGKHAAMLATSVAAAWPTGSYRDPAHPLQVHIRQVVGMLAGEPVSAIGVDGCGAPLFSISLIGLARAFRALVLAEPGTDERRVADAMRANPAWTSGTTRPEAAMVSAAPGLLMKSGAEGVCAFALADGRAGAVKFDDGAQRAVPPVIAELLARLLTAGPGHVLDVAGLVRLARTPVTGGGMQVGEIRAVLPGSGTSAGSGPTARMSGLTGLTSIDRNRP
jgi:L-asparaginase II